MRDPLPAWSPRQGRIDDAATTHGNALPAADMALAGRLFDTLREETKDTLGVTRAAYGAGEQLAHDLVAREAREAGLDVHIDAGGNLYAVLPGHGRTGRSIIVGSHLDSVPMGGNFDGAAGVLAGLAIAVGWRRTGFSLADDLVVMAIRAEESNWFPYSYVGSKMALGRLPAEALQLRRSDTRRTLGEHMIDLGLAPATIAAGIPQIEPSTVRAFIELHIEQGPVLIEEDQPVAVVTGIRGSFRYRHARVLGEYAHSGAVPRKYRRDAVVAAADLVMRLQRDWLHLEAEGHDMTFTVGQFATDAAQHAFSKIAGEVALSIDVRSQDQATLDRMHALCLAHFVAIEAEHGVVVERGPLTGSEAAKMASDLVDRFATVQQDCGLRRFEMASGAGHDTATFAAAGVPSVMLFVRNQNGSHNPDEAMEMADFELATHVLSTGLTRIV